MSASERGTEIGAFLLVLGALFPWLSWDNGGASPVSGLGGPSIQFFAVDARAWVGAVGQAEGYVLLAALALALALVVAPVSDRHRRALGALAGLAAVAVALRVYLRFLSLSTGVARLRGGTVEGTVTLDAGLALTLLAGCVLTAAGLVPVVAGAVERRTGISIADRLPGRCRVEHSIGGWRGAVPVGELQTLFARRWLSALGALAAATQVRWLLSVTLAHERPPIIADAAVFEHMGWYLANGGRLYAEMWEPKPPLSYETTALVALVFGGDPYRYHVATVLLTMAVAVAVVVLVGKLAYELTGEETASFLAGLAVLALPGYHLLAATGFKTKYYLLLAGLLGIYLALERRYFWSGFAAAASVGYWQASLVFPAVVVGLLFQRGEREKLRPLAGGAALLSALLLLPVVVQGVVGPMISEAVFAPLVTTESKTLVERLEQLWQDDLGYGLVVVLLGVAGLAVSARRRLRTNWWAVAGIVWFALVVLALDYDSYPDLIPGMAFVGIGVALLYAEARRPAARRVVGVLVVAAAVVSVVALGGVGGHSLGYQPPTPTPDDELYSSWQAEQLGVDIPSVKYVFWNQVEPDTCHYRLSGTERRWVRLTGGEWIDRDCGDLADGLRVFGEHFP